MKKKIFGTVLIMAIVAVVGLCGATATAFAYDTTIDDWGVSYFNQDTTGLYWYNNPDSDIPDENYEIDPTKPTIIYTHGWKPSGQSREREGLSLKSAADEWFEKKGYEYEYDPEFYRYYIKNGYNVGVFFWNQFADNEAGDSDLIPDFAVDQKIWTSKVNGQNIMRYATYTSSSATGKITAYDDPTNPNETVSIMFGNAIIKALGKDFSSKLHLVGHSMGGQLVLATGEYLCVQYDKGKIGRNLLPERVTILDPYIEATICYTTTVTVDATGKTYEPDPNSGLVSVGTMVADATDTLRAHGIPIDGHMANAQNMVVTNYAIFLEGDQLNYITKRLKENCVWVFTKSMRSSYGGKFHPTHVLCVDYFFTTVYMNQVKSAEGLKVPYAKSSVEDLQALIGLCFVQETPSGENALYYNKSTYELIDFATMRKYSSGDKNTVLSGKLNLTGASDRKLTAKLMDKSGTVLAETNVDQAGYYYFHGVEEGDYTVAVFLGKTELATVEAKPAVSNSIQIVMSETDVEVPAAMGAGDILQYVIIAFVVIMIVIVLAVLIGACRRAAEKRKNAC